MVYIYLLCLKCEKKRSIFDPWLSKILGYSIVPATLKEAAQSKIARDYKWSTSLDSQVWIPGIVPGITAACAALTNETEGIITAIPVYHPFHLVAGWVNCPLITFEMVKDGDRWTYDFEDFENVTDKVT